MGFVWVHVGSFLHRVASPFPSFVTITEQVFSRSHGFTRDTCREANACACTDAWCASVGLIHDMDPGTSIQHIGLWSRFSGVVKV